MEPLKNFCSRVLAARPTSVRASRRPVGRRTAAILPILWRAMSGRCRCLLGDRKPFPVVVRAESVETSGVFSPAGRWIAYRSNEGGQFNVYVHPFPSGGGKHQVSVGGGTQPVWRADGRELFYLAPD